MTSPSENDSKMVAASHAKLQRQLLLLQLLLQPPLQLQYLYHCQLSMVSHIYWTKLINCAIALRSC